MKTAQEMADFYIALNSGKVPSNAPRNVKRNLDRNRCVDIFGSIENSLRPNDDVLYAFIAYMVSGRNLKSLTSGISDCGIAFTADKCIIGQKSRMGDTCFSVLYDNFSDIRLKKSPIVYPFIIVDFLTEEVSFQVAPHQGDMFFSAIMDILENYRKSKKETQNATVVMQTSAADELKKFKELLDSGVITQEEFDAKKKQLLGL